jgi:hypothetical protein
MSTGCFNPEVVSRLHTETGTFALGYVATRARTLKDLNGSDIDEVFQFFSLHRTNATITGALCRMLPFSLEPVVRISYTAAYTFLSLPSLEVFPSRKCLLRAQFDALSRSTPMELKGSLVNCMHAALEELEKGTLSPLFDPFAVLQGLVILENQAKRQAVVAGYATQPYCLE